MTFLLKQFEGIGRHRKQEKCSVYGGKRRPGLYSASLGAPRSALSNPKKGLWLPGIWVRQEEASEGMPQPRSWHMAAGMDAYGPWSALG